MTYTAISPGVIPPATAAGPTPSSSTAVVSRTDEGGNVSSLGPWTIYNVDRATAVPAGVVCTLERSPGGNFFVRSAPDWQPVDEGIGPNGVPNSTSSALVPGPFQWGGRF